jgi:Ca-activated chloride channel family protein
MTGSLDFFRIMGVPRDATPEEIRTAYFELARQYHPDANPDPAAREHFLVIQDAYSVLSNPERRADYESRLPPPPAPPEIAVNVQYSRMLVPCMDEPQLVYALVELLSTSEPEPALFPPTHVCLVVDRSTSMQGARMDMVKANIIQFFKQLKPQDLVSVVAFSDRAEVIVPPSRPSDLLRNENRVSMIQTSGATEIYRGLEAGMAQLAMSKGLRMVRHLILMTDGHTYGDEAAAFKLSQKAAAGGVTLSALGLGHEWNDAFLDKLASLSGGNAMLVTSAKDLNHFLEQKLRALTSIYARRICFDFQSSPKVELRYAFRLHPDIGPVQLNSPMSLGDLPYGKSLTVLLEFMLPPISPDMHKVTLADGRLTMDLPTKDGSDVRLPLRINRPVAMDPKMELPPAPIIEALSKLSLYKLQERARSEVSNGNIDQATRHLQHLATHLLSQGKRELAHAVLVEAEHIQQSHQFSPEGEKRIKYGTRALLLPSGSEQNKV